MLETIPEIWLTSATPLKAGTLFALATLVFVALFLGYRHRRQKGEVVARHNRHRSLFQLGATDRASDRTAELINELRQRNAS